MTMLLGANTIAFLMLFVMWRTSGLQNVLFKIIFFGLGIANGCAYAYVLGYIIKI